MRIPALLAVLLAPLAPLTLATTATAQSFNIDLNATTGAGSGVPPITFGGAASQGGAWNNIPTTGAGPFTLNSPAGNPTAVTIEFGGTATGGYTFDNANISGDHALLLEDGRDVPAGTTLTWSIRGLEPGKYEIYTYAIAPDNATFTCTPVWGSPPSTTTTGGGVGGTMPANAFVTNVTHGVTQWLVLPGQPLNGSITRAAGSTPGSLGGIQLKKIAAPARLYVGPPAPATPATLIDGNSWTGAIPELRDALAIAAVDNTVTEIWCRGGIYKPTATTDRTIYFRLRSNLAVYGSFAGTETLLSQRILDRNSYTSILDADIGAATNTDNSKHVVYAAGVNSAAILDGFTLRNGYGSLTADTPDNGLGGGIYIASGSPTLRNLRIERCTSFSAGAVSITTGAPLFTDVDFISNGGQWGLGNNSPIIQHYASSTTGLIPVEFTRCTFRDNQISGGTLDALIDLGSGAFHIYTNCLFADNGSGAAGGAVPPQSVFVVQSAALTLNNCTIAGNLQYAFGAIWVRPSGGSPPGTALAIRNSIIWGNRHTAAVTLSRQQEQLYIEPAVPYGSLIITDSIIEGWDGSIPDGAAIGYNDGRDPKFVNAFGADNARGGLDGDFHLRPGSPAIDSGWNGGFGPLAVDLDKLPRLVDIPAMPDTTPGASAPVIDRGCYEFQASTRWCLADIARLGGARGADGLITTDDLVLFLSTFFAGDFSIADIASLGGALVPDGQITTDDLVAYLSAFFAGCP